MKLIYLFRDGTTWEWEDNPKTYESIQIKKKYFSSLDSDIKSFDLLGLDIKHPDIMKLTILYCED